jgi:hypothetical protein
MPASAYQTIESSHARSASTAFALVRQNGQKYLSVNGKISGLDSLKDQEGDTRIYGLTANNAQILRHHLPWLNPVPLGYRPSFGFGDRLGTATPGHSLAARDSRFAPVFAQQSVRENARTGRNPQSVLDDAMWGVFEVGWREPWGADADHIKTRDDLVTFLDSGYTFFTIDPGDQVQARPTSRTGSDQALGNLPWDSLETTLADLKRAYAGKSISLPGWTLTITEDALTAALITYGRALAHVTRLYRFLLTQMDGQPFDFEISVDETDFPTSPAAHYILAREMTRLGITWTSLAPRFTGRFEKGVDYIGDLTGLDAALARHAAVLSHFGHFKISLHSGSDKFSVYPLLAKHFGEKIHVKTAGTSYLEALRVIARRSPDFFRAIYDLSRQVFPRAKATYHVSADLSRAPADLPDKDLPHLLDQFNARQILHVAYGDVLDQFGPAFMQQIQTHQNDYTRDLHRHFRRHLNLLSPNA